MRIDAFFILYTRISCDYLRVLAIISAQMLKEERQHKILSILKDSGKVLTLSLSQSLHVSEDTIRRDLKDLSDAGKVKKVHGGAILASANPFDFRERQVYARSQKTGLAQASLASIRTGQVIFMDGGTTNLEVASLLPNDLGITVFTNSLPIGNILSEKPGIKTEILGGTLLSSARVTVGPEVISKINSIRADLCILGIRSLHHDVGITEIDWDETQVKRAMVESSASLLALVIEEKFSTSQPYRICPISRINTLISPLDRQDERLIPFKRIGTTLIKSTSSHLP